MCICVYTSLHTSICINICELSTSRCWSHRVRTPLWEFAKLGPWCRAQTVRLFHRHTHKQDLKVMETAIWEFPKIRGQNIEPQAAGLSVQGHPNKGLPIYGTPHMAPMITSTLNLKPL